LQNIAKTPVVLGCHFTGGVTARRRSIQKPVNATLKRFGKTLDCHCRRPFSANLDNFADASSLGRLLLPSAGGRSQARCCIWSLRLLRVLSLIAWQALGGPAAFAGFWLTLLSANPAGKKSVAFR
jgi:hypothetical protein